MRSGLASLLTALVLASPAGAQERRESLEHAGSVGLFAGVGPLYSTVVDCPSCAASGAISGFSGLLDVGGLVALGSEGFELSARLRLTRFSGASGEALLAGVRRSFGRDEWKSYFEVDLEGILRPTRLLGPRAALGVLYDFSAVFGIYLEGGVAVDLGAGRRVGADVTFGAQLRSFLLQ